MNLGVTIQETIALGLGCNLDLGGLISGSCQPLVTTPPVIITNRERKEGEYMERTWGEGKLS